MSESYTNLIARGWTRHEAFEEILRRHPPRKTYRPGDFVVLMVRFGLHGGQYCYLSEDDLPDYLRKEIGKLFTVYLPQTASLIGAYRELFRAEIPLTEIEKIRDAILDAIAKSNDAYDAILQSLFMRDTLSLYAEISALKNLFAMDGLTAPDFHIQP